MRVNLHLPAQVPSIRHLYPECMAQRRSFRLPGRDPLHLPIKRNNDKQTSAFAWVSLSLKSALFRTIISAHPGARSQLALGCYASVYECEASPRGLGLVPFPVSQPTATNLVTSGVDVAFISHTCPAFIPRILPKYQWQVNARTPFSRGSCGF